MSSIPLLHQCTTATAEALISGVTGRLTNPSTLLLGGDDTVGNLRMPAWTTPRTQPALDPGDS